MDVFWYNTNRRFVPGNSNLTLVVLSEQQRWLTSGGALGAIRN
jgi:hypothetical protein